MRLNIKLVLAVLMLLLPSGSFLVASQATTEQPSLKRWSWISGTPTIDNEAYLLKYGSVKPDTGNPLTLMVSDFYLGFEYAQDFDMVLEGVHARIWIGLNDSITLTNGTVVSDYEDEEGNFHFFYPWTDTGLSDPAPYHPPGYHDIISMERLEYVLQQFDQVIYPTDTSCFGMPKERPSRDTKIDILIFNIRDEVFWSPMTAPYYIGGYFSSALNLLNDKNIVLIDAYMGPMSWPYEPIVAHELQHLIHYDKDPDEELWVDEGCADFAQFLCGYGHPINQIAYYLVFHPFTSLTFWDQKLENYGASYLFILYLYEHYGGAHTISSIVAEQANGIEGINNVLKALRIRKDFDRIFQDWTVANYLDDTTFAGGIYGYKTLDIPSADTGGLSIEFALQIFWEVPAYEAYPIAGPDGVGYIYGEFRPYTAHYIRFANGAPAIKVRIHGAETTGYHHHSLVQNNFKANIIQKVTLPRKSYNTVRPVPINQKTQLGSVVIPMLQTKSVKFGTAVVVVTNQPGFGTMFFTTYTYSAKKVP